MSARSASLTLKYHRVLHGLRLILGVTLTTLSLEVAPISFSVSLVHTYLTVVNSAHLKSISLLLHDSSDYLPIIFVLTFVRTGNGLLDPWHGGGFLTQSQQKSLHVLKMRRGAHHLDLRGPHPADPPEVTATRMLEEKIIWGWIEEASRS